MKVVRQVPAESAGQRVDRFLADSIADVSRSRIKVLLAGGFVTCAGRSVEADHKVVADEEYICSIPDAVPLDLAAENIPLSVVYEDADIIVVNKPAGLVVHPAAGHSTGTLVNALLGYCRDLPVINGEQRPGIVHRLDKDTSGLIVVALNDRSMQGMQKLFKDGGVHKIYSAIVRGVPLGRGTVESEIGRSRRDRKKMASVEKGGRHAVTEYTLREAFGDYALLEVRIHTGRTHQIRVHMSDIGHPIAGDSQYGGRRAGVTKGRNCDFQPDRQMLHAWKLSFNHPVTGERLELVAEYPEDFSEMLAALRGSK